VTSNFSVQDNFTFFKCILSVCSIHSGLVMGQAVSRRPLTAKTHVHVATGLYKTSVRQFFLKILQFSRDSIIPAILHTYFSSVSGAVYSDKFRASLSKTLKELAVLIHQLFYTDVKGGCVQLCLRMYVVEVVLWLFR
jgi:hypothetical protein